MVRTPIYGDHGMKIDAYQSDPTDFYTFRCWLGFATRRTCKETEKEWIISRIYGARVRRKKQEWSEFPAL